MGITMDEAINGIEKRILPIFDNDADHQSLVKAIDTMRKYQKLQADYENRLKADLKAILVELQLKIEENQIIAPQDTFYDKKLDGQFNKGISKASEIIQQKINSLKEA